MIILNDIINNWSLLIQQHTQRSYIMIKLISFQDARRVQYTQINKHDTIHKQNQRQKNASSYQ
jgi:hypothetical protein